MTSTRRNGILIAAMLGGVAVYAAIGVVVGSWFWIGGAGFLLALMGWAGDSLVRTQRATTPPRESIRLAPISQADMRHGPCGSELRATSR